MIAGSKFAQRTPDAAAVSRSKEMRRHAVHRQVDADLARAVPMIRAFFGDALHALVLGGGYGRGEGGLLWHNGAWHPENDYDLFAILHAGESIDAWRPRVAEGLIPALQTGQRMEYEVGLLCIDQLATLPPTQMFIDLRAGHRVLAGTTDVLTAAMPERSPAALGARAGLDLVLNRAALLLTAERELTEPARGDLDLIRLERWMHKVELAVGDAVLMTHGLYHPLLRRRTQRFTILAAGARNGSVVADWAVGYRHAAQARLEGFIPVATRDTLIAKLSQLARALAHAIAHLRREAAREPHPSLLAALKSAIRPKSRRRRRLARLMQYALATPFAQPVARRRGVIDAVVHLWRRSL
jgi:hypothetical protein